MTIPMAELYDKIFVTPNKSMLLYRSSMFNCPDLIWRAIDINKLAVIEKIALHIKQVGDDRPGDMIFRAVSDTHAYITDNEGIWLCRLFHNSTVKLLNLRLPDSRCLHKDQARVDVQGDMEQIIDFLPIQGSNHIVLITKAIQKKKSLDLVLRRFGANFSN